MAQGSSERESQVDTIAAAAERLARAHRLLVLGGAGLSADAGIPTFRGAGGLWHQHDAQDLASPTAFATHPERVWEWYRERRLQVACAEPHAGQRSLAMLQKHSQARILVATTNEDDLLERAGVSPVVHLHGSLFDTACSQACGWRARDDQDNSRSFLPCPRCGAPARPGSVWFDEAMPRGPLQTIAQFDPDACLLVGSSMLVAPVSEIPPELAGAGHPVVEINPEETPFSRIASQSLRGPARDILPMLVDLLTSSTVRGQVRKLT